MKRTRKEQRELEAASIDAELENLESIEDQLEAEVRYYWKATRWYLGHEAFDFSDPDWCGCDCNRYNRHALRQAIGRLRAWRTRREYCI